MALKVDHEKRKKLIKRQARLLANFQYDDDDKTEYNYIDWLSGKDYTRPEFRDFFNIPEGEIPSGAISYLHKYVMREAWNYYWENLHDKLQQKK